MAYAVGSRSDIAYVAETTFGTTPSTPQMILLPKQSLSLDMTKDIFSDPTLVSDQMEYDERHGNIKTGGDLVVSLRHGQFDDLIEATMGGTWSSNVVDVGTTLRSFTFEEQFLDITQYRRFTGCRMNTMGIEVNQGNIVTATFGIVGAGMTTSQTALDASQTAIQAKTSMSHIGGTITVGGSAVKVTAVSLNIDRQLAALYAIGSSSAFDVAVNTAIVTGSATFYYEDLVQYNRFLNETSAALVLTLTDGTNTLTFTVPKTKFNSATIPVADGGPMFQTVAFKGIKDPTTGTSLRVTRSA